MSRINNAVNEYGQYTYESAYQIGDWDIIPESFGQVRKISNLRVIENKREDVVKRVHPETIKKRRRAIIFCIMIVFAFAMMTGVVYRYASISEMHIESVKQKDEIKTLTEQINALEVKVNTSRDLNSVMKRAGELGMDFAATENIEYIELNYQ